MTRLLDHFEPEDPIECPYCSGLYDLRFWKVLSDTAMQCPKCKRVSRIDEAIRVTKENTRKWTEEPERASSPRPEPTAFQRELGNAMVRLTEQLKTEVVRFACEPHGQKIPGMDVLAAVVVRERLAKKERRG